MTFNTGWLDVILIIGMAFITINLDVIVIQSQPCDFMIKLIHFKIGVAIDA